MKDAVRREPVHTNPHPFANLLQTGIRPSRSGWCGYSDAALRSRLKIATTRAKIELTRKILRPRGRRIFRVIENRRGA